MLAKLMGRKRLFVAVAVVVASLGVGGYGYAALQGATNNVYTGCLKSGQISAVAIGSTPRTAYVGRAKTISWSEQGPPGNDGTSVTSDALSTGDPKCPNGGSSFTSASGMTYACNGAPGPGGVSTAVFVQPSGGGTTHTLLSVAGLGEFDTTCGGAGPAASVTYVNTTGATVDYSVFFATYYGPQQSGVNAGEIAADGVKEIFVENAVTDGGLVGQWQLNASGGDTVATIETSALFDSGGDCVFRASSTVGPG